MTRSSSGPSRPDRRGGATIRPLVGLAYRASPRAAAVLAALTFAWGVLPATLNLATGAVVSALADAAGQGWGSRPGQTLALALTLAGAAYAGLCLLQPLREAVGDVVTRRVDESLTLRVMGAAMAPAAVAHLEDPAVQDRVEQARGAITGHTPGMAVRHASTVVATRVQGVAALGILATFRWWLPLAVACSQVLAFRVNRRHWLVVTKVIFRRSDVLRRSNYLRRLTVEPESAKETRVFGLDGWLVDRYRQSFLSAMDPVWGERRKGSVLALLASATVLSVEAGALWAVAEAGLAGEIGPGAVAVYAQAVLGAVALGYYNDSHLEVTSGLASLAVLEGLEVELTEALPAAVPSPAAATEPETIPAQAVDRVRPSRAFRFECVSFRYPGQDADVFSRLDLDLEIGRSTAIVGDNGAGKTTMVKLAAGLYVPTEGRITADGVDVRDIANWSRHVAAIFQDFTRYPFTAHDNVAVGALHRATDTAAVERAARLAGADGVVHRLAGGWETVLDRRFSGGTELSGGEWQRIALARALFAVAGGATLLVLDEPTAALDARAEADLYDRFLEITHGVTTVLISHRFSTVRRADRIVVLDAGSIVEDGTHDQLMAVGGRYARMYGLQAMRFAEEGPSRA